MVQCQAKAETRHGGSLNARLEIVKYDPMPGKGRCPRVAKSAHCLSEAAPLKASGAWCGFRGVVGVVCFAWWARCVRNVRPSVPTRALTHLEQGHSANLSSEHRAEPGEAIWHALLCWNMGGSLGTHVHRSTGPS